MPKTLQQVILEEFDKFIEEQQAERTMRKNIDMHQKVLVFLDRKLSDILNSEKPAEELQNMANVVLKSDTPTFLSQILKVGDAEQLKQLLPNLVKSIKAINPPAVKQYSKQLATIRAIVKKGIEAASDKLGAKPQSAPDSAEKDTVASQPIGEGNDPLGLFSPTDKAKKRHDKKHPKPIPAPKLEELFGQTQEPTDTNSALGVIRQMRKQAGKLQKIYSARLDQGRRDAAEQAKTQLQKVVDQIGKIKEKFSIQEEAICKDETGPT